MSAALEVADAVRIGHSYDWDDMRILKCILRNKGGNERRELIVLSGDAVGISPTTALRRAFEAGEIPTPAPPPSLRVGTLQRIIREDISR